MVSFKPGAAAAARAAANATGGKVEVDLDWINAVAVTLPVRAVPGLSRNPAIEMIEPDPMRHALQFTGGLQINPDAIQAVQADLMPCDAAGARKLCIPWAEPSGGSTNPGSAALRACRSCGWRRSKGRRGTARRQGRSGCR